MCPNCFRQVPEGAETCSHCGKPLVEKAASRPPEAKRKCPNCGKELPPTVTQFCPSCSFKLAPLPSVAEQYPEGSERIVWSRSLYKGFIHREKVRSYVVSDKRCYVQDDEHGITEGSLPIGLCEVTLMNLRIPPSSGTSYYLGDQYGGMIVSDQGDSYYFGDQYGGMIVSGERKASVIIGDLYFMDKGRLYFVFRGIPDPYGVKALIDSLKPRGP
jgi:hypothetical protein